MNLGNELMNEEKSKSRIVICMGSSCFSRGNNKNLEVIKDYISKNNLNCTVNISGNLCEDKCSKGPNVKINERLYSEVEPNMLLEILNHTLK
jgi:NADH:ubiquinone oxidoreductase subunit E